MIRKLLACIFTLASLSALSQTVASSCSSSTFVVSQYRRDADRLAARRVHYANDTYKDSVRLKPSLRSNYLRALLAVYNATALPVRDSIIVLYNIHTDLNPEMNSMYFYADGSSQWMQNLLNSVSPLGYAPVDNLMSHYHLNRQNYFLSSPYDRADLKTDTNCNMKALINQFAAINGVISASVNAGFNDVRNITDSINPNFTLLTYSYGWGTCENGCDARTFWKFKVYNDCSVEYMGQTGTPLTSVGIQKNKAAFGNVTVYPNPASSKLHLSFDQEQDAAELSLINTLGQEAMIVHLNHASIADLDVSALEAGMYCLHLKNIHGSKVMKIVKE